MEESQSGWHAGQHSRAWYHSSLANFLQTSREEVIGNLTSNSDFNVVSAQVDAWQYQIDFLKTALTQQDGSIFLEFNVPRMGRRIDAVLLIASIVFVVEFKVGAVHFDRAAIDQVWDYALDLKNFHEASHGAWLVPVLVATEADECSTDKLLFAADHVSRPIRVSPSGFRAAIDLVVRTVAAENLDPEEWQAAPYRPTPTIIEAARALYVSHSVEAISRHDAGAKNLRVTSARIEELIDQASQENQKAICFVTGVPGAGKTLVGLDVATRRRSVTATHAVFLSGNGPLVAVLREALTRDAIARDRALGLRQTKGVLANPVKAFIQNVHHFRDEALHDSGPPCDRVVIFDEAQRAWNAQKTSSFMNRKRNQADFRYSEPAFLLSYMNRSADWNVVVCLVGEGQEIHTGEGGIDEWFIALNEHFPAWNSYVSPHLLGNAALGVLLDRGRAHLDDKLHLAVSMRSFRAENVSSFVAALLNCEPGTARDTLGQLARFPIALTRDLQCARTWIRAKARGNERYGLVASSKALRLKPHAIDVRVAVDPVHWFLNGKSDVRSSYYLEDCATEFQVQGLELDWACVTWDADLRFKGSEWTFNDFRGNRWQTIRSRENRNYLRNAYRVLLTRARQGMILFVPPGDPTDPTRLPEYYNSTFEYLCSVGLPVLS